MGPSLKRTSLIGAYLISDLEPNTCRIKNLNNCRQAVWPFATIQPKDLTFPAHNLHHPTLQNSFFLFRCITRQNRLHKTGRARGCARAYLGTTPSTRGFKHWLHPRSGLVSRSLVSRSNVARSASWRWWLFSPRSRRPLRMPRSRLWWMWAWCCPRM